MIVISIFTDQGKEACEARSLAQDYRTSYVLVRLPNLYSLPLSLLSIWDGGPVTSISRMFRYQVGASAKTRRVITKLPKGEEERSCHLFSFAPSHLRPS